MINSLIVILLAAAFLMEILYILFRNPNLNKINIVIYPVCIILSLKAAFDDFTILNMAKLAAEVLLLTSMIYLKNKPFEKPDYRYFLILSGTIIIQMIK
jgi:hypothetical protein